MKQDLNGPNSEIEHAFTICACKDKNKPLVRGSEATGGPMSVSLAIACPAGYKAVGIHHTHPNGHPLISKAEIQEAKKLGLKDMCVTVPQSGVTKCYEVTK